MFIAGRSDWGTYQTPGAEESMRTKACTDFHGTQLVDGAGHWAQQEQPEAVSGRLIDFLKSQPS
jgi:pimeloyl-ACP methyl ester carboxylesterase